MGMLLTFEHYGALRYDACYNLQSVKKMIVQSLESIQLL